ncbi:MAG: PKD domain-containing protein [Bacteroidia bacterium]|nr:PKD domain-containing protein [Bacteroidia bacterium]
MTRYSSFGRKNLSLVANGQTFVYYDFLDIRDDGSGTNPTFTQSADTVCLNSSVTLTSSLVGAANYAWDLGGAAPSVIDPSAQSIEVLCETAGTFTITHQTYSPCCGWSDPIQRQLVVLDLPRPTLTISSASGTLEVCTGQPLSFIAQLEHFGPNPSITWLVNNSPQGSGTTFTLLNPQQGDQVQAVAVDNTPCGQGQSISSNTLVVTVHPLPQPQSLSGSCITLTGTPVPGELLTLSATAIGGTPPYTFYWDLGDGRGAVGNPATILYPEAGTYQIRLRIVDSNGCESSSAFVCETTLVIYRLPIADFAASPMQGCPPLTVSFQNLSSSANAYRWDFGDGFSSTQSDPTHTYTASGEYTVTLYAISATGTDTARREAQVIVYPVPVADFSVFPPILYESDTAYFVSQSQGATSWQWFFGDPLNPNASSTDPNPAYFYSQPGRYSVTLIVENLYGCRDTLVKPEAVIKLPNPAPGTALGRHPRETFRVYPNPCTEVVLLHLSTQAVVALYEGRGKLLWEGHFPAGIHSLNLSQLPSGLYFLRIGPHTVKLHKI